MFKKLNVKERENLYGLVISQLLHDGFNELANHLASAENIKSFEPSDRLLHIFAQGLSLEAEEKKKNPVKNGIDLEFETEAACMAEEPCCYGKNVQITHNAKCCTGAFSNDGKLIATGCKDACIQVMETDTHKMEILGQKTLPVICTLDEHKEAITCLEFHPANSLIVSGSKDSTIKVFDFGKRFLKRALKTIHESSEVESIALHPSGQFILVSTQDPVFKLYDLNNSSEFFVSDQHDLQHKSQISMIRYSPDAKIFATCSRDGDIKVWDTVSNRCVLQFPKAHEGKGVCSIQFSRNSKYLLSSACANSPVKLWEISMGRPLIQYKANGVTGSRQKDSQAVFNHTEDYVLFPDEETRYLCCWNSRTAIPHHLLSLGHINSVNFLVHSPSTPAFFTCSEDMSTKFWYTAAPI